MNHKNKRIRGTMPKTSALRKAEVGREKEEVVVPSARVATKIRASLRAIRAGETVGIENVRSMVASSANKRIRRKKSTSA